MFAQFSEFYFFQSRQPRQRRLPRFDARRSENHDRVADVFFLELHHRLQIFRQDPHGPRGGTLQKLQIFVRRFWRVLRFKLGLTLRHGYSLSKWANLHSKESRHSRQRPHPIWRRIKYTAVGSVVVCPERSAPDYTTLFRTSGKKESLPSQCQRQASAP